MSRLQLALRVADLEASIAFYSKLVIAALAEITTLTLLWPATAFLLPVARFPALLWLVTAGVLLPARRPRRAPRQVGVDEVAA